MLRDPRGLLVVGRGRAELEQESTAIRHRFCVCVKWACLELGEARRQQRRCLPCDLSAWEAEAGGLTLSLRQIWAIS